MALLFEPPTRMVDKMISMNGQTSEEVLGRITSRFDIAVSITEQAARGEITGAVIYGKPGVGKTFAIEETLNKLNVDYNRISGVASPGGLYDLLYNGREKGQVILADDCDSILDNDDSISLLKAALDTKRTRSVSWNSKKNKNTPSSYNYEGSLIFITNTDFRLKVTQKTQIAKHLKAIIDRTLYVDLSISSPTELLLWIRHVAIEGRMLEKKGLTPRQCRDVLEFFEDNAEKFHTLSVRQLVLLANLRLSGENWEKIAQVTMLSR